MRARVLPAQLPLLGGTDVHDSLQETINTLAQAERDAEIRLETLEVSRIPCAHVAQQTLLLTQE